ncbi:Protein Jumonji [Armadillidium vulgare]|nr:Protein Jumonji [Armadillidium vulgare]
MLILAFVIRISFNHYSVCQLTLRQQKPVDTFLPETVSSSSLALAQSSSLKSPPEELKNSNTNCTENADESSESHEPLVIEEENDNSENSKNDDNIPLDESVFPKSLTSMKDQIIQSNDLSESNNIIKVHGKEHKIVSERKSSFIPSIPPVVTSPVVSQALSKLFPVAEPLNNVSFLGNKPISLSSSQTTSSSCSQSNDALVKPPISHMIFSNFVYTTTSIVIPKMLDQSMTSPKAVTKVSQSSPPYVLSTSTSNEMPVKSSKINTKANLNTLKDNSIPALKSSLNQHLESGTLPDSNLNTLQNDSVNSTTELETNLVDESICKASEPSVAKILDNLASSVTVSIFPKVQTTISPTCISSVPEKQNDNKLNANIFYSNQSNRVKIQSDRNKHNHPFTTSASHITNFAQDKSEKIALMNSKSLNENKSSKNRPVCSSVVDVKEKKGKDLNHINHFHQSQNILDINQPHTLDNLCKKVQSKSKVLESRNEKKREPILKKTLFKNKNSIDKKTSDAFSPLNESSVYAFEPDTEPPLEMTSPFISKIVKTPCHTEASTSTTCLTSTTNVNKVQNAVKNSTVTNVVSVVPTKLTSHAITSSALKASNKLPFVNNKVNTSCTAHSSNIKSSSVNNILSTSSRKPITSQIPPNCNTLQLKEITAEIRIIKNQEQDIGSGKTVSLASKSPKEKINLTESKDKEKIYEKERKLDNILPRICSSENITEDNIPQVNLKDLESESNDSEDLDIAEVNISEVHTKATNSTSIAIQCDLDDSMSEKSQDGLKGSESGTQTEGPSKFPLPPSASPFYYLPLAMATLGEKLPAQLVQQMLAKTQGLVGAAEAGLILQQAAQLAQQYHKSSDDEGTMSDSPSPAVKPISPKSGSIALQKALKANLASIAQAEISVAQSSGIHLNSVSPQPFINNLSDKKDSENSKNSHIKGLFVRTNSLPEYEEADANILLIEKSSKSTKLDTSVFSENEKSDKLEEKTVESEEKEDIETEVKVSKPDTDERDDTSIKSEKSNVGTKSRGKRSKVPEVAIKRRSGRSSTLAATKATESDLLEIEEMRRNRRAKRAAAILAKEESWSSSSEAPLSPIMSPDMLRGWPPPRLTSPTPSQSSEGTNASSSTVSQRSSRMSGPHSRRHSPASSAESSRRHSRYSTSSNNAFSTDPVLEPGPLRVSENPNLTRAPSFFPSEEEFTDPLDYIEKIRPEAEQFGLCRIVPPSNFRPECRVNDDMRFTAYKQYIHRMMKRWGPNDRTLCAIKKCLTKQNIELSSIPVIGGIELDLVQLYNVVENHGGLMKVIEKELWSKVADALKVPKSGQDRLTKGKGKSLLEEVDAIHNRTQSDESSKKSGESSDDDDDEEEPLECMIKGKSTALSAFYRIARNIAGQWQPDPSGLQMDERYWEVVRESENYLTVHTASIDTSEHGYGFPSQKTSPNAKHPWNLKNLCQNTNSVLRSMGKVIGVTAPTLHVGMMFSTVCWYRDPHSLPWIEYLHTGACKIWYGVSSSNEEKFRTALIKLVPDFIKSSPLWLPSDTAMVPPEDLIEEGVKVCRVVQEPGQFVVVFPGAFTSSVCSGYLISESAFFARPQYFDRAMNTFQTLTECCEPSMFSLDRLALSVASDAKATQDALLRVRQVVTTVVDREKRDRQALLQLGLTTSERLSSPNLYRKRKNRYADDEEEVCCEICRQHLYVSLVTNTQEETVYCPQHAAIYLTNNLAQLPLCKIMYTYSLPELTSILKQVDERIQTKTLRKHSASSNKKGTFDEQDSFSSTSSSNF